jgi:hypothetical protein
VDAVLALSPDIAGDGLLGHRLEKLTYDAGSRTFCSSESPSKRDSVSR